MQRKVRELAPELNVEFVTSNDGSGLGAALIAAVESRIHKLPCNITQ